ncbi:MAG: hypothetical protein ACJATI_004644, partial [Halioglobus sp.]
NEKLHVHISESNISSVWPEDWTDKYYVDNNGVTTSIKIGYEITSSANNSLLGPGVDGIPMDQYVNFYTEGYIDPTTNTAEVWKVYRYEIPWIPINPDDVPAYVSAGGSIWACILARITTPSINNEPEADPMTSPEGDNPWDNNKANNNIAIRNTSIHRPPGFTGGGSGGGVTSGLNVKSPPLIGDPDNPTDPTDPNSNDELDIEIAIHPNNDYTDDGDPIIPSTTGPGDPVIFEYVNVEIILSDEFLAEWTSSGLQGSGFAWINANTIKVTSPTFNIKAIKLPPRKDHRIFVKTTSTQDFTAIDFTLLLKDSRDRVIGSQTYNTRGSLWIDRSGIRSDGSRSDAKSTIAIHPNPAQDYITVSSKTTEISKIEVYSVSNERMNVSYQAVDTNTTRVDITDLSAGIYFMRVQREGSIETVKFVKF